jgi:glutathione synthase/RimK-type ligase-like ATP-grasp enzyme
MKLPYIGTTEYIKLPEYVKSFIPAKIDTGAGDSAIWASSIQESGGSLSFILFGPSSFFYTGETISTDSYNYIKVKNSFGISEYRYKVKLRLKIGNKIYKSSFSLADRSKNRYPILLGKKFLSRRFAVDVSKANITGGEKVVRPSVVLASRIDRSALDYFDLVRKNLKSDLIVEHYDDLKFYINEMSGPNIQLSGGLDLAKSGVVYLKSTLLYPDHAYAIAKYLQYRHVPFFDKEISGGPARSKLSEVYVLSTHDIAVPGTIAIINSRYYPEYGAIQKLFGSKFVFKPADDDNGKYSYLVDDKDSYLAAINESHDIRTILIQRYIPNDGFIRVLMMGNNPIQITSKISSISITDNNLQRINFTNESVTEINKKDYNSDVIALAQKASLAMKRSISGVDIVQDKNNHKLYVIDVNYNPNVVEGISVSKRALGLSKLLNSYNKGEKI